MNPAADIFRQAAQSVLADENRTGNLLEIDASRNVIFSGDIHGNRTNLTRLLSLAGRGEQRPVLVLQEIIHGPLDPRTGQDRSIELLLRAARTKLAHPENVFILLGNHDVAQVSGGEITKEGRGVCKAFREGVDFCFAQGGPDVYEAAMEFLRSLPLAIRFANGALAAHSLPYPNRAALGGTEILGRPYRPEDFKRGGPAYEWTWGRDQSPEQLDALAAELGVEFFLLGHRHVQSGWMEIPNRAVAINTDGPGGCVVQFRGDELMSAENIESHIHPLSGL